MATQIKDFPDYEFRNKILYHKKRIDKDGKEIPEKIIKQVKIIGKNKNKEYFGYFMLVNKVYRFINLERLKELTNPLNS